MIRYENSLEIASPISEDANLILSKSNNSTSRKFQVVCFVFQNFIADGFFFLQDELQRVTEQLKKVIDLSKETRNETQILHGQYDTDAERHIATLMRHDKTEREQMSVLIEHKQSLIREIEWIGEQKKIIDNFIARMAPTLDQCVCDGPTNNSTNRNIR